MGSLNAVVLCVCQNNKDISEIERVSKAVSYGPLLLIRYFYYYIERCSSLSYISSPFSWSGL